MCIKWNVPTHLQITLHVSIKVVWFFFLSNYYGIFFILINSFCWIWSLNSLYTLPQALKEKTTCGDHSIFCSQEEMILPQALKKKATWNLASVGKSLTLFFLFSSQWPFFFLLGPERNGCGCGCECRSLRMRVVAVSDVIKRFVWLAQRFKIIAFAGYLWLVDYKILQQFNNKLSILTYYNLIKI